MQRRRLQVPETVAAQGTLGKDGQARAVVNALRQQGLDPGEVGRVGPQRGVHLRSCNGDGTHQASSEIRPSLSCGCYHSPHRCLHRVDGTGGVDGAPAPGIFCQQLQIAFTDPLVKGECLEVETVHLLTAALGAVARSRVARRGRVTRPAPACAWQGRDLPQRFER